jgi:hypothetical protein
MQSLHLVIACPWISGFVAHQRYTNARHSVTIFVDHFSDVTYVHPQVHPQKFTNAKETFEAKQVLER